MIGLLLAGIVAFASSPSRRCRRSITPRIVVSTVLPGASAETMASSVTSALERSSGPCRASCR
jgi:multidrug efflux pump